MSVSLIVLFLLSIGWMARGEDCGKFNWKQYVDLSSCSQTNFSTGITCTYNPATGVCSGGSGCDAYNGNGDYPATHPACSSQTYDVPCNFNPIDGTCSGVASCTTHSSTTPTFPDEYFTCSQQTYPTTTPCSFNTENGQCSGSYCGHHGSSLFVPFPAANPECTDQEYSAGLCSFDEETGMCSGGGGCEGVFPGTPKFPATFEGCTSVSLVNLVGCSFNETDGTCKENVDFCYGCPAVDNPACTPHASSTSSYPSTYYYCESHDQPSSTHCTFDEATGTCSGGEYCSSYNSMTQGYPDTFDECTVKTFKFTCGFDSKTGVCASKYGYADTGCDGVAGSTTTTSEGCDGSVGCYSDDNDCETSLENTENQCFYNINDGSCYGGTGHGDENSTAKCGSVSASQKYIDNSGQCANAYVPVYCTYNPADGRCNGPGNCSDRSASLVFEDVNGKCSNTPVQTKCKYNATMGYCYGDIPCNAVQIKPTSFVDDYGCETTQGTAGTCTYNSDYGDCYGATVCNGKRLKAVYTDTNGCASSFVRENCEYAGAATGKCTGHTQCSSYDATANVFVDENNCGMTSTGTISNCYYDSYTGGCIGGSSCESKNATASSFTDNNNCGLKSSHESCSFAETTGACSGNAVCSAKDSTTISTAFPNTHPACTDNDGCTYAAATGVCSGTYTDSGSGSLKIAFPAAFVVLALLFLL